MTTIGNHVADSIKSAGIGATETLVDKVTETLRKMQNKLLPGALGKAESGRIWLAVEIACRQTNTMFERGQLLRQSTVGEADYQKALNTSKAILGISGYFKNVSDILSLQYSQALMEESKPILAKYDRLCVSKMPSEMKRYVDITSPLYVCASFYVAALIKKIKINKAALSTLAETPPVQFLKLVDVILEVWKRKENNSEGVAPALLVSSTGVQQTQHRQHASLSSKVPPASFSGGACGAGGAGGAGGPSAGGLLSLRQSLALRNNNAQNIALNANASNMDDPVSSSSGSAGCGKRKYASSLLERLHSRADSENILLHPTDNLNVPTPRCATALSENQANMKAQEEAERAEAAKRAEREAFEAWRDAKIAEKRAKKACA